MTCSFLLSLFYQNIITYLYPGVRMRHLLNVSYLLLFCACSFIFLIRLIPYHSAPSVVQINFLQTDQSKTKESAQLLNQQEVMQITVKGYTQSISIFYLHVFLITFLLLALLYLAWTFKQEIKKINQLFKQAVFLRRIGRIHIYISEHQHIPLSLWIPGRFLVFMPAHLISSWPAFRLALWHEVQHHQQGDTQFIYVLRGLQYVCGLNPFYHLFMKHILIQQELACDEAVVDHVIVSSHTYATCLLQVAEQINEQKNQQRGALSLAFLVQKTLLTRRINMILRRPSHHSLSPYVRMGIYALLLLGISIPAYATRKMVQDVSITNERAMQLKDLAQKNSELSLMVNNDVIESLDYFLNNPKGKQFITESLDRMKQYQPMIESKLKAYGLPHDFLAIPVIESGYRNLPDANRAGVGAGLWMFIASTAQEFGLKVTKKQDDRLDPATLTDAAMRLLLANKLRFQSNELSLLAYNIGEKRLQEGIDKTNSRDPLVLQAAGFENDPHYIARFMAVAIIMNQPN